MTGIARMRTVVIDCPDPATLAEFYRQLIGPLERQAAGLGLEHDPVVSDVRRRFVPDSPQAG